MELNLSINREAVYLDVDRYTNYTGAKMSEDVDAYERISTTDEDHEQLDKFWDESLTAIIHAMHKLSPHGQALSPGYSLNLTVSSAFDLELQNSVQKSLHQFMVKSIAAKWFALTNKAEAGAYADEAKLILDDVREKVFYKKRPTRPSYYNKP